MRRADKQIPEEEAVLLLENCLYGILSCVTGDGRPYSVPLSYVYINSERAIYFHCAKKGEKLNCIAENPNVCFTVVDNVKTLKGQFSTLYESVIAFGAASLTEQPDEKRRVLSDLCEKYEPGTKTNPKMLEDTNLYMEKYFDRTAIVKIDVKSFTGKAQR